MKSVTKHNDTKSKKTILNYLKFIIPSFIGLILFVCPVSYQGDITIPIAIMSNYLQTIFRPYMENIIFSLITISFVGSLIFKIMKLWIKWKSKNGDTVQINILNHKIFASLFDITNFWFMLRCISFFFACIIYQNINLEMIQSSDTGGLVFYDLLPILFTIFLLAGILLPLLLNFGLLEFTGALLVKIMRPVFGLPGRSAIDAIASWLGDGTIGVLLTSKQFEEGFYTEKEACIIGTNFSLVSITFSIVVINTVGLPNMFLPFYLTVTFACIIAAIIIPKLPPLSKKKNLLFDGTLQPEEVMGTQKKGFKYGVEKALTKVEHQKVVKSIVIDGMKNVLDMWIGVIPIVLTIGTIALIIAEYSPIFTILGLPYVPLLHLLQIPEAVAASKTLFAGFADMLLPSVMIANVESELTRFVIAAVSVSQLIYLSEVGSLLIASKIPIKMKELILIFIERTLITLPIIAIIAHLIF